MKFVYSFFIAITLLASQTLAAQKDFSKIDAHARNAPASVEKSVISLSKYLLKNSNTDIEKARAIYVWLTHNISYDDKGYNSGNYSNTSAESVLKNKIAVCSGFSNLYYALGKEMGLNIKKVVGYSKGYSYISGSKFKKTNHAWNIININKQWRVFDATWGQGYGKNVNGKLVSSKEFEEFWFNVDPYEAIFSHLPKDIKLSYVTPRISLKEYENFPKIKKSTFVLGFEGKTIYQNILSNRKAVPPTCSTPKQNVKIIKAPMYKRMFTNKNYTFQLQIPKGQRVAIINKNKDWIYFEKNNDIFTLKYTPKEKGEITISIQYEDNELSFYPILRYMVKTR